jgi:hypothetical protein
VLAVAGKQTQITVLALGSLQAFMHETARHCVGHYVVVKAKENAHL